MWSGRDFELDDLKKDYARYRLEKAKEDIGNASEIRNASDYDDMFIASKSETIEQIGNAKMFLEHIEKYVEEKLGE